MLDLPPPPDVEAGKAVPAVAPVIAPPVPTVGPVGLNA